MLGEQPPLVGQGQIVGVELLLRLGRGDESGAEEGLASVLELAPLGAGVSEQNLRPMLALSYVLVADTREFWDRDPNLGPATGGGALISRLALLDARSGVTRGRSPR